MQIYANRFMQENISLSYQKSFQVFCAGFKVMILFCILLTEIWFLFVCVSHVSVLDVLPVHQHVVPAQCPYLALTGHHMALKLIAAVSVDQRRRNSVDAVLRERGHWLSEKREKDGWVQACSNNGGIKELILDKLHGRKSHDFSFSHQGKMVAIYSYHEMIKKCTTEKRVV